MSIRPLILVTYQLNLGIQTRFLPINNYSERQHHVHSQDAATTSPGHKALDKHHPPSLHNHLELDRTFVIRTNYPNMASIPFTPS
jgi:hypothetical protein